MLIKDTLIRPLITEKSMAREGDRTRYAFEVATQASKEDIRRAVEAFFQVEVEAVNTLIVRGKTKRFGRFFGKRSNWKKAYVTLRQGQQISLFEA